MGKEVREPSVSRTTPRNSKRNAEGAQGGGQNGINTTINLPDNITIHTSGQRGWVGVAGGVGGKQGDEEDKGNGNERNAKERDTTRSLLSFSSEKEVEEPWPLPLL